MGENLEDALDQLDYAEQLTNEFLQAIEQSVYLKFSEDSLTIFFEGAEPTCPIPGIDYKQPSQQVAVVSIGDAFTAFYQKLHDIEDFFGGLHLYTEHLDDVYCFKSDLRLLEAAVQSLDDAAKTPTTLIEQLTHFLSGRVGARIGPIYGNKDVKTNDVEEILKRYINCDKPDYKGFLLELQNDIRYEYYCKNLYQVCGAILDYLCHYKRYEAYSTKPFVLSLRRCPRCGRYFTTADRKIIYCQHVDEQGKTCADWQEVERKKKLAQIPKNNADQLAEKIRCRLYSYRNAIKTSRDDHTNDPRLVDRDNLYKLYLKCRKKYSKSPNFDTWIAECAAQLPKSRNESYDKFKKWLLERS